MATHTIRYPTPYNNANLSDTARQIASCGGQYYATCDVCYSLVYCICTYSLHKKHVKPLQSLSALLFHLRYDLVADS